MATCRGLVYLGALLIRLMSCLLGEAPQTGPDRTARRRRAKGYWSSPRWPDTSTKSAFDVREWTQRVGKEFCWEGIDRDASSPMSSNVDAVEIVRTSGKPI